VYTKRLKDCFNCGVVETIYYDSSEGHSEFEVTKVECDFEDINAQDNGFLDMSQMGQVLEGVPEIKVGRKGKGKSAEQGYNANRWFANENFDRVYLINGIYCGGQAPYLDLELICILRGHVTTYIISAL
jgi:hypothetical protein